MALSFSLRSTCSRTAARRGVMTTLHGSVETPAFMTVGTRATVTGLTPADLREVGTQVVLGNAYHLMLRPGREFFERVGGIHAFMGWTGPVLTDSGGYQIFSLPGDRTLSERGARFRSYVDQRRLLLSPESSIEMQTAIGSDIMMVLDVCLESTLDREALRASMGRTHRWALRSLAARKDPAQGLFAIVQGGLDRELRQQSVEFLTAHAFDGFAIGGLAVGDARREREVITAYTADLLPRGSVRYLMGVGTPADLLVAVASGVDIFDCVLPTHLAWQGTAFTNTGRVRLTRGAYKASDAPLDPLCPCATCKGFSRSYLHYLLACGESLAKRALSIHNLTHYGCLMAEMRQAIAEDRFASYFRSKLPALDRHEHSPQG